LLQELMTRGILAPSFVVSYSHTDDDVDRSLDALEGALRVYRGALEEGIGRYLKSRPVKPVFRRYA
jgi:glutamate-1-semialdehyde 2,1-aminomutase